MWATRFADAPLRQRRMQQGSDARSNSRTSTRISPVDDKKRKGVRKESGIAQQLQDVLGEVFFDFGVARDGLGNLRGGVVIPIVLSAVTNKHATIGFELSDEIFAFHRSVSSASFRTPGISPLVRSR